MTFGFDDGVLHRWIIERIGNVPESAQRIDPERGRGCGHMHVQHEQLRIQPAGQTLYMIGNLDGFVQVGGKHQFHGGPPGQGAIPG